MFDLEGVVFVLPLNPFSQAPPSHEVLTSWLTPVVSRARHFVFGFFSLPAERLWNSKVWCHLAWWYSALAEAASRSGQLSLEVGLFPVRGIEDAAFERHVQSLLTSPGGFWSSRCSDDELKLVGHLRSPGNDDGTLCARLEAVSRKLSLEEIQVPGLVGAECPKIVEEKDKDALDFEEGCFMRSIFAGTFDRLHCGHRLLLTFTFFTCREALLVGVAQGEALLGRKQGLPFMQTLSQRLRGLGKFLEALQGLVGRVRGVGTWRGFERATINDPVGPAGIRNDVDALVVTEETKRGGEKVNEVRVDNGLEPLRLVVCPGVVQTSTAVLSSTTLRKSVLARIAGLGVSGNECSEAEATHRLENLHCRWNRFADCLGLDLELRAAWWLEVLEESLQPWTKKDNFLSLEKIEEESAANDDVKKASMRLWIPSRLLAAFEMEINVEHS